MTATGRGKELPIPPSPYPRQLIGTSIYVVIGLLVIIMFLGFQLDEARQQIEQPEVELEWQTVEVYIIYDTPTGNYEEPEVLVPTMILRGTSFEEYESLVPTNYVRSAASSIVQIASETKAETVEETVWNTLEYIEFHTDYVFRHGSTRPREFVKDWQGDCTEKAKLMVEVLKLSGIKSRTAHGHAGGGKHDFVEVWLPDLDTGEFRWETVDYLDVRKKGTGIW